MKPKSKWAKQIASQLFGGNAGGFVFRHTVRYTKSVRVRKRLETPVGRVGRQHERKRMAVRKTMRPERVTARRATDKSASEVRLRRLSAIVGSVLICATLAWFGWLVARQHNPGLAAIRFPGL
jgi:hypothetical protein